MEPQQNPKRSYRWIWWVLIAVIAAIVALFVVVPLSISNNSGINDEYKTPKADNVVEDPIREDTAVTADTMKKDSDNVPIRDTVAIIGPNPGKSATLGYHYYPAMNIHESQEINVFLAISGGKGAIRDTLLKIVQDEDPDRDPADTGKIEFKEHIPLYKFVSMELVPLDSGIRVSKVPDFTRQEVDTLHGNTWSWSVYASSAEKEVSTLALTIKSENPDRVQKRVIHIRIHVERNIIRICWNYLAGHPKEIVGIITAIVGALWGAFKGLPLWKRYRAKKKGK